MDITLVRSLLDPNCYLHPVEGVELIETHISYVLLAGEFAYKLKKPVRLPFLDYSTPELRRRYCEEEVRLNRRTAPGLYLGVVDITDGREHPVVGGSGSVLECAVKMRRFPREALLSEMARSGRLDASHVDALAESVAAFHQGAARAVRPAAPAKAALDNFSEIAALGAAGALAWRLNALEHWTRRSARALEGEFAAREATGRVRECHGDLHLGNVALVDGRPLPFDGIEFSESLRWIDVANDLAFAAMDLHRQGLPGLAARFVDRYLARTGDYGALAVLRFYMVYRAMVRAKVAALGHAAEEFARQVALAERLARRGQALLVAMHGLPASGKSTVAARLVEALGGVRVRSDVERKRLHGLGAATRAAAMPGQGIYTEGDTRDTYERLAEVARVALAARWPVIVDATFARREERERFAAIARQSGAQFRIVSCRAPEAVLRERIAARAQAANDASDAGLAVLEERLREDAPLADEEAAVIVDTHEGPSILPACAASTSSTAMPTGSARCTS